ncbi:ribonuclease H-like domain-containing protein [Tanacetum coccineum]
MEWNDPFVIPNTPYQPARQYRAAGLGFYQRNNGNSSYPDRRQTLEESLTKFMTESAKRHEENSNIIKKIQAFTDAAIRNQGSLIETLEIKIGQMSKVLQERGIGGLPGSTEPNPRDHVKSISTTKADSSEIRRMGCSSYAISGLHHRSIFSKTVPFPRRLQNYYCDDWRKVQDVKILKAYDQTLPQKEIVSGSFTLPCFIHNVCFDKALVDLGASVSVMPFSTYTNLGLGILSHTRLTIELADGIIKQPRGIDENVLVRIDLDSITKLVGEDNDSFDPIYGNYIELDDLDTPLEPETNQDVDFEPTVVNEPDSDKDGHEGKSPAGTLIDIPVFVGKFSILAGFIIHRQCHVNDYEEIRSRRQVQANDG